MERRVWLAVIEKRKETRGASLCYIFFTACVSIATVLVSNYENIYKGGYSGHRSRGVCGENFSIVKWRWCAWKHLKALKTPCESIAKNSVFLRLGRMVRGGRKADLPTKCYGQRRSVTLCHGNFLFAPSASNTSSCPNTSFPSFLLSPYCSWGRFQDTMWMILLDRYLSGWKISTLRARKVFPDGWYAWASNVFQMDMSKGARMLSVLVPLQENASSSRRGSARSC